MEVLTEWMVGDTTYGIFENQGEAYLAVKKGLVWVPWGHGSSRDDDEAVESLELATSVLVNRLISQTRRTTHEDDLKKPGHDNQPCPFCGSMDTQVTVACGLPEEHPRVIECTDCGVEGPIAYGNSGEQAKNGAWARWNHR